MAFLNLTYSQINYHIQSSQHALDYSRSNLQGYLEKKLAGMEHLHEQEYNSFYNSQLNNVKEALIDILCSELGKRTGIYITQNVLENLDLVIGTYKDIMALPDKIQNFVDSAVAAVNAAFLPMNSELVGRYTYFSMYLDCRKLGDPNDIVFQTAMDYNFFAIKENAGLGEGIMNCLPGISGWTENRQTIDRWAECIYQMEQKNNIVSTGGEEETPDIPQQNIGGKCGDNVYWEYNKDTEILTITGNGEMSDYYSPISSKYAPWHDYNIEKVVVCDNVTTIGNGAFYELKNLKSVKIPTSIKSIKPYAFGYCESLEQIEIPKGVASISSNTFWACKNLTKITLPDELAKIGKDAFGYCERLEQIEIPDNVMQISEGSFYQCTNLKKIEIPEGVTQISDMAFEGCLNLSQIALPNGVTRIGNQAFSSCRGLTQIEIPESVNEIGRNAFSFCDNLSKIKIPNGVTRIEEYTFYYCKSLTQIEIPSKVTNIGEKSFMWCDNLKKIYFKGMAPTISAEAFSYVCSDAYYPYNDWTWTYEKKQNFGGKINWISTEETSTVFPDTFAKSDFDTHVITFCALAIMSVCIYVLKRRYIKEE